MMTREPLGWIGIVRLGLVQTALGSVVVLTTSTLNRVMVVELAMPAMLPGALVALHYAVQLLRPRLGFGSDLGGRRTPWIVGGIGVLATGGIAAAVAIAWMASHPVAGIVLAIVAFFMIGVGVGAAGTTLLVLLAKRVAEHRRAAAATVVWVMMIGGFSVTAGVAGHLLDPFSPARLVIVTTAVSGIAFLLTLVAVWNVEGRAPTGTPSDGRDATRPSFREALSDVWSERRSRRFAVFVFVSMLAYSAQDLILEPFAGTVFGFTPGGSTKLSGMQHGGVLVGMLTVGLVSSLLGRARSPSMQAWTAAGCIASAAALCALVMAGLVGPTWPLQATVFALGATNGIYAVSAIGSMMALVGTGRKSREGVRMGFWGAAQAIAFGLGGFLGTLASDGARAILHSSVAAYATVFSAEALLFLASAVLAIRLNDVGHPATLAAASGLPAMTGGRR